MAHPNLTLIGALRKAAAQLRNGAPYAWGHHGSCNCGHLLQVVTHLSKEEILRHAHTGIGEWTEIAEEYCGVTQVPAYLLVSKLEAIGLTPTDIHCLEYLKDREILERLPGGFRWLQRNVREDVVLYFETMANYLEEKLLNYIDIPEDLLSQEQKPVQLVPVQLSVDQCLSIQTSVRTAKSAVTAGIARVFSLLNPALLACFAVFK